MRWWPRQSYWAGLPQQRYVRHPLDHWLHQSEWIPVSDRGMVPMRSVAKLHDDFRRQRLKRPGPWRLRERVRQMRAARR